MQYCLIFIGVGLVIEEIHKAGMADDTLIIFSSASGSLRSESCSSHIGQGWPNVFLRHRKDDSLGPMNECTHTSST